MKKSKSVVVSERPLLMYSPALILIFPWNVTTNTG